MCQASYVLGEPFYYFGANGKSNNGPLATDRPNTLKGYVYYMLPWKKQTTTVGLFQTAYQGSPQASFIDIGTMFGNSVSEAVHVFGRDKWVNMTQDPSTGAITLGNPYTRQAPWFTQTDLNLSHSFKTTEHQTLGFSVNVFNVLGQRVVTSYYGGMNSIFFPSPLLPQGNALSNASSYQAYESGYNVQSLINGTTAGPAVTKSSQYGMPFAYQNYRSMRFGVTYSF